MSGLVGVETGAERLVTLPPDVPPNPACGKGGSQKSCIELGLEKGVAGSETREYCDPFCNHQDHQVLPTITADDLETVTKSP
jgi:hypothetical protein